MAWRERELTLAVPEILKILLKDEEVAEDVDLKALAKRTEFFSGSDLKRTFFRKSSRSVNTYL